MTGRPVALVIGIALSATACQPATVEVAETPSATTTATSTPRPSPTLTPARKRAVEACRAYRTAVQRTEFVGTYPDDYNAGYVDNLDPATTEAEAAARLDPRWQALKEALDLTVMGDKSEQGPAHATVSSECASAEAPLR